MLNTTDVIIIQKKTTFERYAEACKSLNQNSLSGNEDLEEPVLKFSHEEHSKSRELLVDFLNKKNLSFQILTLDDLKTKKIPFFSNEKPGSTLNPKQKLVISLGGDGTLLHASHHIGEEISLVGINSCPTYSVGHMCRILPEQINEELDKILSSSVKPKKVRRLKVSLSHDKFLPLALNDVLICHKHPAATSRLSIGIKNLDKNVFDSKHKVISSGIWVSTPAGQTAAISTYNIEKKDLQSSFAFVAIRELYDSRKNPKNHDSTFLFDGEKKSFHVISGMRQGIVCIDGPDFYEQFAFGDEANISLPKSCSLQLF